MTTKVLSFVMLTALFFTSCKETSRQENVENTTIKTEEKVEDDMVTILSTDLDGNVLELVFNNTKGTVLLNFKEETIELPVQKAASGFWYKNDTYELRGKGNNLELKKDSKTIFKHKDDIVTTKLTDKDGQTLDMTFNNSAGTAKVYLNGGEQIDLVAEKAASGIWYKNETYELRGKGKNVELTKDGNTIFKN